MDHLSDDDVAAGWILPILIGGVVVATVSVVLSRRGVLKPRHAAITGVAAFALFLVATWPFHESIAEWWDGLAQP